MPSQPTEEQKYELSGCIAVAVEVNRMENRLQELKNLHDLHKKQFVEQLKVEQENIERYLPMLHEELERRKTNILMRGQPHG